MFVSRLFRINKAHGREFIFTAATALAADVPLQPALLSLAAPSLVDCFPGRVRRVIRALDEGRPLSWALDRHLSAWCPKHWAPAIAQAEEMGHLPDTLNILASQTGSSQDDMLRGRLRQFTAYLVGFITIISGLLIFIMPKFAKIFDEMAGAPLPASTEFLFYFSDVIRSSGLLPLIFFLPFVISGIIRGRMANLLIQLPILGRATRLEAAQQSARSLATALRGSVDMVTAVTLAAQTCTLGYSRQQLLMCAERLRCGEPWNAAWRTTGLFGTMGNWVLSLNVQTPHRGFVTVATWTGEELKRYRRARLRCIEIGCTLICAFFVAITTIGVFDCLVMLVHYGSDPF